MRAVETCELRLAAIDLRWFAEATAARVIAQEMADIPPVWPRMTQPANRVLRRLPLTAAPAPAKSAVDRAADHAHDGIFAQILSAGRNGGSIRPTRIDGRVFKGIDEFAGGDVIACRNAFDVAPQ